MTTPAMTPVDSSNIDAIGYDEDERKLYVRFTSARTYVYFDVSPDTHQELIQADSKGSYLNREIRHNYEYEEL